MNKQIVAHTSFIGHTGYNNHSKNFFTSLNRLIPTRIRNYTYHKDLSYLTPEQMNMLITQDWPDPPHKIGRPFVPDPNSTLVNIVLNESHHYYFYDKYESPMIAYNVWEATRQIPQFFDRILEFDQFWCPTEWQRQCTIEQGYPEDRVKVVPEAVNVDLFKPAVGDERKKLRSALYKKYNIPEDHLSYMMFYRWDYRKSVQEIVATFLNSFKNDEKVVLILSADNPFSNDGMKTTEERLKYYGLESDKIRVLHFPERSEYVSWMRAGDIFLSCSRAEGWNLPLSEAIACGIPTICSEWGAQLEFAQDISRLVKIEKFKAPENVFMLGDNHDIGVWAEPDFQHLHNQLLLSYDFYNEDRNIALKYSNLFRKVYTWDNAAITAEKYINELCSKPKVQVPDDIDIGIKLNLGCGNDLKPGYINIDKYNNTGQVDLKCDLNSLPFDDGTVDEIYTSHVFEHIGVTEIYAVMSEWKRVLRPYGRLVMMLPNLEHEVKIWLNTPDDKKWFEVHRIFGSQSHPGNAHFSGHNPESLKHFIQSFGFEVTRLGTGNRGYGEEIQLTAKKDPKVNDYKTEYITHFVDGPFGEVKGNPNDKSYYQLDFLDPDNEASVHQQLLNINCWTRPYRKYFTNWLVQIRKNGILEYEHKFNLGGKRVLVSLDSKSLGDTIAWIPPIEEFRKKHKCEIFVSTFWNNLFDMAYTDLRFVPPGSAIPNLYASYSVGCYDGDMNKNKINWRLVSLQKVCSDTLGIDYDKEIITNLAIKPGERTVSEKYVTISEFSTFQCKFWNCPGGWQLIVDWLNKIGYKVMVISKEKSNLQNVIDRTNRPIEETITNIYHSEFFMGVSAGPAWLAWALRKPVVMISGYSHAFGEFQSNIQRVINEDVCHGCFNDVDNVFDRGNWNWCPRHEGTVRQFECTKQITPLRVQEAIKNIIGEVK